MTALYTIGDFVGHIEPALTSAPMPALWYLLRLHPNYDMKAERQLHERGISAYVPKERRTLRTTWGRKVTKSIPVFPGAMFVPDFDADIAKLKRNAEGIGGFVKSAGQALRISLKTMDEIRKFEAKRNLDKNERRFQVGQRVRIKGGPFDMLEGRIDRLDTRFRLTVLIGILQGEVPSQFDEDQVEAV